jgi:hypothetical protein
MIADFKNIINTAKEKIDKFAKTTKFKIRKGKLQPLTFVMGFSLMLMDVHEISLSIIAGKFEAAQKDLDLITKQAIEQRLETGSKLMEECFKHFFEKMVNQNFYHTFFRATPDSRAACATAAATAFPTLGSKGAGIT